jgi:hypothetical protein
LNSHDVGSDEDGDDDDNDDCCDGNDDTGTYSIVTDIES